MRIIGWMMLILSYFVLMMINDVLMMIDDVSLNLENSWFMYGSKVDCVLLAMLVSQPADSRGLHIKC